MSDPALAAVRYRRAARVATRELPDRVVACTVDDLQSVELQGTGMCLWLAVDPAALLDEIVDDLAAVFKVPAAEVRDAVVEGLRELEAAGLVEHA